MIDCHCHVMPRELVSDIENLASRDRYFGVLAQTKGATFATADDLLRSMENTGVEKAVIFGFAFEDTGICRVQNDYVMSVCRDHPSKFIWLGVISPESPGAMREAERCLECGAAGFGELFPAGHGFSLDGPGMRRLAGLCGETGTVLLVHVNEQIGHQYPGKGHVGPEEAFVFAAEHPDNLIIFAHLGGGLPFYMAMPEVADLRNIYFDTAAQPFLYRPSVYDMLKASGALDRVVLGSDYPLLDCRRYLRQLQKSRLELQDVDKVVRGNARHLFGRFFQCGEEVN